MIVNITLSFASAYDTSCIRLLSELGLEDDHTTFEIYKRITKRLENTVAVYPYNLYMQITRKELKRRTCFKPIKLIIDGADTKKKFTAMSHNVHMSNSLWLLIMNKSIPEYLAEVNLQFDVELIIGQVKNKDLVEFQEAYRVDRDYPLRISQFGKWTRSNGLDIPTNHLYERRTDLEGKLLKVGSIENWPMSSFRRNVWDGYFPRIWKELAGLINSTIKAYISRDNATGSDKGNGNWSGLVGMVLDGSIDVIAAEITMNKQRSEVISFTKPVLITNYKVYLTSPGRDLKWDAAFRPFDADVWTALLIWIIVGTISMALCYRFSWSFGLDSNTKKIFNVTESFFFVLQSLCQQGYSRIPRSSACRIVILTCFLVSSIIIPSYSASVISSLTHEIPDRPFSTLEDMLAVGTHKLLVIPNSGQFDHFKLSDDPLNQKILKKLILTVPKENQVKSISEALSKAFCKLENYAFFSTQKIFEMKIEYKPMNCTLVSLPQVLSPVYQSLVLKKGSPFLGLINFHLQKLFDAGIVNRIEKSLHRVELVNFRPNFIDVDVDDTFQIFALLTSGLVLSLVLLIMELLYSKCIHGKCWTTVLRYKRKSDKRITPFIKRTDMKTLVFSILLFLPSESCQVDITTAAEVTKAIADWFQVPCIVVLRPAETSVKEEHELFTVLKIMFENDRMKGVSVKNIEEEHISHRYNRQRCPQMLQIIYGDNVTYWMHQLSDLVTGPGPIWLMFLQSMKIAEVYLKSLYLPFNSNFIAVYTNGYVVSLDQMYRVSMSHPLRTVKMAEWTPKEGLTFPNGFTPYWQRYNLEGKVFRVSAIDNWPLAILSEDNSVGGYFGKIWLDLEERLNFTTIYVPSKDFSIGVWNGKRWNGLIGMIMRNEIDFAISEITMTPERLSAVDFLKPLFTTRPEVWLTLLVWLFAVTLILFLGYRIGQKYGLEDPKYKWEYESYHCLFFIVSAFSMQGNTIMPKSVACRLTLATAYLFSTVFVILYSCTLTSMVAVQKPSKPFDSLETFLQDGTYTLEQIPGSDSYTYFSESTNPVLQEIYHSQFSKLPEEELPKSHRSAIDRICRNRKIAHMGEFGVTQIVAQELTDNTECDIIYLDKPLKLLYLTMAVTKDSPYRAAFDHQLQKMIVSGILRRFQRQNFPLRSKMKSMSFKAVRAEQVAQMNVLLLMGMSAALLVLCCELALKSFFSQQ
ncbi:UNVERIFIED_CONTAM: hypothetical protein PYX00_007508 [Menopon gallinae]|uniref:Uncharacterized protein n=1 Tax=Menopon gallinae TaxID=328185 RepID=A0AAW2HJH9_9NEOP